MTPRRPPRSGGRAPQRPTPPKATTPPPAPAPPAVEAGDERRVTLAAVVGAHGVTGEVRLKLFTEDLSLYPALTVGGQPLTLKSLRAGPNGAVARFAEIGDRNAAEALRGAALTVPRSALPALAQGEYYHADLIGLPCFADDKEVGFAVAIENFGAGDIVEVEDATGRRFMVPMGQAVTVEADRLRIDPAFVE